MTSRAALNLFMLVLLLGLGLFIYLQQGKQVQQADPLTALSVANITTITVTRADKPTIVMQKQAGSWWLRSPVEAPANRPRINALLGLAQQPSRANYAQQELELARYGLVDGNYRVVLNDLELVFGNRNPVNNYRYVKSGEHVHMIDDNLVDLSSADTASFISARLLPRDAVIDAISLPGLQLQRNEQNWQQQPEAALPADAIQVLLQNWQTASALWVRDLADEATGSGQVVIRLRSSRQVTLDILAREPELVLANREIKVEYHLPMQRVSQLVEPQPVTTRMQPTATE